MFSQEMNLSTPRINSELVFMVIYFFYTVEKGKEEYPGAT